MFIRRFLLYVAYENLKHEIELMSPKIVFLLGEKVYSSVEKEMNTKFCKWNILCTDTPPVLYICI